MAGGEVGAAATTLEQTPTWVVAAVCTVIVAISLAVERILHFAGKLFLLHPPPSVFVVTSDPGLLWTLMMEQGKIPALSYTAVHHLHIFIFVLAVVHVVFCALTVIFGSAQIRRWKRWEDDVQKKEYNPQEGHMNYLRTEPTVTYLGDHAFIRSRFRGIGKRSHLLGWLTHCKGNRKFNFHNYMMRALEVDFKRVVGISWYLWMFVVGFLLLNVYGWHAYFYLAFVPFVLLLAVGTKLEHVISQLAHEVAEKHAAIEGDLVVTPSDEHFWWNRPRLVLILIHIILFQNSFELAFFFFIWIQYGFDSCIMGQIGFIIPRLIVGAFVQVFCSYSTLPLYAIVTQMGSTFKKAIFEEHIQEGLVGWAQKARDRGLRRPAANGSSQVGPKESSQSHHVLQMTEIVEGEEKEEAALKESNAGGEIEPAHRIN
ncbi:hypothetical protein RJ639_032908 [Escallonia herrerae]|uniref:MLO-like protein n=1 Tax=Escallonia herrerae TaxID=1293975 RepID=A0AA88X4A6_9ASTE|nr:hypothetical protein RJ639_032908 [Escallonia herrerae]